MGKFFLKLGLVMTDIRTADVNYGANRDRLWATRDKNGAIRLKFKSKG